MELFRDAQSATDPFVTKPDRVKMFNERYSEFRAKFTTLQPMAEEVGLHKVELESALNYIYQRKRLGKLPGLKYLKMFKFLFTEKEYSYLVQNLKHRVQDKDEVKKQERRMRNPNARRERELYNQLVLERAWMLDILDEEAKDKICGTLPNL